MRKSVLFVSVAILLSFQLHADVHREDWHTLGSKTRTISGKDISFENALARFFFLQSTTSFSAEFKKRFVDIDEKTFTLNFVEPSMGDGDSVFCYLTIVFTTKNGTTAMSVIRLVESTTDRGIERESQMLMLFFVEPTGEKDISKLSTWINPLYGGATISGIPLQQFAKMYFETFSPSEPNLAGD